MLADAILSLHLVKPGGLLIFDNYAAEPVGTTGEVPTGAINAFYQFNRDRLEVAHKGYQVIFRKTEKS